MKKYTSINGLRMWVFAAFLLWTVSVWADPMELPGRAKLTEAVVYKATPQGDMVLDLFQPDSLSTKNCPVFVFIHGGSWMHLSRHTIRTDFRLPLLHLLLREGYAVVSIEYRLISADNGVRFPAPLSDCKDAIRWIRRHATDYHFDPARIAVGGCSAGAHLALLTAYAPDAIAPSEVPSLASESSAVNCCVDIYGPTHLGKLLHPYLVGPALWAAKRMMNKHLMEQRDLLLTAFTGQDRHHPWKRRRLCRRFSPVDYADSGVPTLLLHGDKDQLVRYKQSKRLVKQLKKHNVYQHLSTLPGQDHGFPGLSDEDGNRMANEIFAFLQHYNR